MTAAITKARRLRTGSLKAGYDTLDMDDPYILRVNEQVSKTQMIGLWLAYIPALPIPKETIVAVGGGYAVCDDVTFTPHGTQRYVWDAVVKWKNLEEDKPQQQTAPGPTGNSVDPDTWMPTITRRPVTIPEPMEEAYYEGGYSSYAHTILNTQATHDPPQKSIICNSAMTPYRANLPVRRRKQSLFSIRWVRPPAGAFPANLLAFENKLNTADVTLGYRGFSYLMKAKTALIESIQLTPVKYGATWMWEINMELIHDEKGHLVSTLDKGMAEMYFPGEPLPVTGGTAAEKTVYIMRDGNGRSTWEEKLLNGVGKIGSPESPVFAKWRDQELVAFASVPLLSDLLS